MDRHQEERKGVVTIAFATKEFCSHKWHYTIIDVRGHRDFLLDLITGATLADVVFIMVSSSRRQMSAHTPAASSTTVLRMLILCGG